VLFPLAPTFVCKPNGLFPIHRLTRANHTTFRAHPADSWCVRIRWVEKRPERENPRALILFGGRHKPLQTITLAAPQKTISARASQSRISQDLDKCNEMKRAARQEPRSHNKTKRAAFAALSVRSLVESESYFFLPLPEDACS
jgi:hypothetical protein